MYRIGLLEDDRLKLGMPIESREVLDELKGAIMMHGLDRVRLFAEIPLDVEIRINLPADPTSRPSPSRVEGVKPGKNGKKKPIRPAQGRPKGSVTRAKVERPEKPDPQPPADELLNTAQVCDLFPGLTSGDIVDLINLKELPECRGENDKLLFPVSVIEQYTELLMEAAEKRNRKNAKRSAAQTNRRRDEEEAEE